MDLVVIGIKVTTDKPIANICGCRINFTDGSWCDVKTGEINNVGLGLINIDNGRHVSNVNPLTKSKSTFVYRDDDKFKLSVSRADIRVVHWDKQAIGFCIECFEDELAQVLMRDTGKELQVTYNPKPTDGTLDCGGSLVQIGDLTFFKNNDPPRFTVMVHPGAKIVLKASGVGEAIIGNIGSELGLDLSESYSVRTGTVGDLVARLSGSAGLAVKHVVGSKMHIASCDDSRVRIDDGDVEFSEIEAAGNGRVTSAANSSSVSINAVDASRVILKGVVGDFCGKAKGSAIIRAGQINGERTAVATEDAKIIFG